MNVFSVAKEIPGAGIFNFTVGTHCRHSKQVLKSTEVTCLNAKIKVSVNEGNSIIYIG